MLCVKLCDIWRCSCNSFYCLYLCLVWLFFTCNICFITPPGCIEDSLFTASWGSLAECRTCSVSWLHCSSLLEVQSGFFCQHSQVFNGATELVFVQQINNRIKTFHSSNHVSGKCLWYCWVTCLFYVLLISKEFIRVRKSCQHFSARLFCALLNKIIWIILSYWGHLRVRA